jgi:hypothetical protein
MPVNESKALLVSGAVDSSRESMYPDLFAAPHGRMDGGVAKDTHELRTQSLTSLKAFFARRNPLPIQLAEKRSLSRCLIQKLAGSSSEP